MLRDRIRHHAVDAHGGDAEGDDGKGGEQYHSPPYIKDASFNRGKHVLHFGGKYDSYLLVPIVPSREIRIG